MSYRNQYSGSPWQQSGPPFGVDRYYKNHGGYNEPHGAPMNSGYNCNQGGYGGGMYYGSGIGNMRNMGYGGSSQSHHYVYDRSGRSFPCGQLRHKRLPQRSPASGSRPKRRKIKSDWSVKSNHHRDSRGGSKSRHNRNDTYNPEEPTDDVSDVEFETWKTLRDKKYPKCCPCRMEFSSYEEYRKHCKSEDHKQNSAEFHYLKNLVSGSDEDGAAIEPVKVKEEEIENKKDDKEERKRSKTKRAKPVGKKSIIPVQGYYCRLCKKFFKDVSVAKSKHCKSIMHSEAFKKAMEEAMEQEEEMQRLSEAQDKLLLI